MVRLTEFIVSIFLILIIFLQIPEESVGLTSFEVTNNLFGSPSSARKFLKILTFVCILIYFGLALQLNFSSS